MHSLRIILIMLLKDAPKLASINSFSHDDYIYWYIFLMRTPQLMIIEMKSYQMDYIGTWFSQSRPKCTYMQLSLSKRCELVNNSASQMVFCILLKLLRDQIVLGRVLRFSPSFSLSHFETVREPRICKNT